MSLQLVLSPIVSFRSNQLFSVGNTALTFMTVSLVHTK